MGPPAFPDGGPGRGRRRRPAAAASDPLADQPSGDSTDDFAALSTNERGWVGNGALAAVIIAAAASFAGLAALFRADAVAGGALMPVSARLEDIWHHASSWWIGLGAGLPGHGDPFGYVLWILGVLGGGNANARPHLAAPAGHAAVRPGGLVRRRRPDFPPPVPARRGAGLGGGAGLAGRR